MKRGTVITLVVVGVIVLMGIIFFFWRIGVINTIKIMDQDTKAKWGNVQSAYQRRADLIPNLVNTVKGYAAHEKEVLEGVVEARAKATQTVIDPSNISPEDLAAYQAAQSGVSSALSRLLAVVENYPDLKANQNFLELQSQLEGTENRINVERNRFNQSVQAYNSYILIWPGNMFAASRGFQEKGYFEAQAGADEAPKVEF